MKTKAEIDAALPRLSARMQALCSELPPEQVLEAFSREARPLARVSPRVRCRSARRRLGAADSDRSHPGLRRAACDTRSHSLDSRKTTQPRQARRSARNLWMRRQARAHS